MKTYAFTINGKSISTEKTFDVKNPATGDSIGSASMSNKNHVSQAVAAAKAAQPSWAAKSDEERKSTMNKVADILAENTAYLAKWITEEQGKPMAGPGSMFEMQACVGWTQVPASLDLPVEVIFEDDTRKDELHRKPIGVIGAIAPWNWPLMIAIWQIIPAIRTGNTVVLKPSEYTTIGTLEMVRLINTVLPPGVLNTVSGGGDIGASLVEHKDVDKIMFTGSVSTARKIIESSKDNMARLTLECGGNDAAIILPGTDIKSKAEDLFWGAFINMGQTCACAKRLYVHENDHDAVVDVLSELASQMPMGNGMEDGIVLGPIQNKMQFDKINDLVEDAKSKGAKVFCGGSPLGGSGYFYPITLLGNVDNGHRIVDEEQFGPVLPIIKYKLVEEAIQKANDTKTGLGGSVWGDDLDQAAEVASKIQAGTVWINQHGAIHPMVPFGGIKESGYGVEFGIEGLKAVTRPQVISIKKPVLV
ncbi:aldehyde dehydrogenase family protein [Psychroflexus sp. MES1-P1E]|uniref:aldehyde dehydrogenase family protein n=1 Tax=Psychroflexus sp. MES1-P1E TaxID=2058320 RepID=UPI000C7A9C31|nr:aldehyde dehydrogenase family protein [Psychroflexus sp. MES1-P1E]PKG43870.1 aldehyde dehydrogenase [Psychroflexus sp. MES1-P1E]